MIKIKDVSLIKYKYFLLYLILFFGSNVLYNIGIHFGRGGVFSKVITTFYPVFLYFLYLLFAKGKSLGDTPIKRSYIKLLIAIFVFWGINMILGNSGGMIIVNTYIFATIVPLFIDARDSDKVYTVVMNFYVLTCIVAILEVFSGHHLFDLDPVLNTVDNCYNPIRATCFQGHSLSNCLLIDIIMLFIAFSPMKIGFKMIYLFMGLVAIIAFGSRSSVLLWCIIIPILILFILWRRRSSLLVKMGAIIFLAVIIISCFWLLTETRLGERIMEHAYFDTSAEIRLRSLNAIDCLSRDQLLWGFPDEKREQLYSSINVNSLENFYVIWILKYGLVLSLFVFFSLFFLLNKSMVGYGRFYKCIIIGGFLLVASTNNSLGAGGIFLVVFYLSAIAFYNKYSCSDSFLPPNKQEDRTS